MSRGATSELIVHDRTTDVDSFRNDVLAGLDCRVKSIPSKHFYDRRGSQLFDRICELDEYYLTRTELGIMRDHAAEMAQLLGPKCLLIEFGSGSSVKTRLLLDALENPAGYFPVDISREHLLNCAEALAQEYPHLDIQPVCADFTEPFDAPETKIPAATKAVYFPGSTIGNLLLPVAQTLLSSIATTVGPGGGLLIGLDLQKDVGVIEAAYNDGEGVTGEFNKNLLERINRELDADIDPDRFDHLAEYDQSAGRIDMHLVSLVDQIIRIEGREIRIAAQERIHTEFSHKYSIKGFAELAAESGLRLENVWTDAEKMFSVQYLSVPS